MEITFDVSQTPFSRYGSYLTVAYRDRLDLALGPGLYIRSVHGHGVVRPELFHLAWPNGEPVALAEVEACPSRLTLDHPAGGRVVICLPEPGMIRLHGESTGLRLQMAAGPGVVAHPEDEGRWVVNSRPSYRRYMFEPMKGAVSVDASAVGHSAVTVDLLPEAGVFDVAIDEFGSSWIPQRRADFETCVSEVEKDFEAWVEGMPDVDTAWQRALQWAAYVNWSCVVEPCDRLKRPAMYMSKNHMCQVWSWDNCFNAMALSYGHPRLAWDQFMVMVDHQDAYGAFPDALNDFVKHYNFSKPPVHGWALEFVRKHQPDFCSRERLSEIYQAFSRWARWWLIYRVAPDERLPHYLHGNDSGWDNSTMFDEGVPLIAPDLAALLALHCSELAVLARELGAADEAMRWRRTAQQLIDGLIGTLWREDHFVAMRQEDHKIVESASLIPCIPIALGHRLPQPIRAALVKQIRRFVTPHGVATEDPDSPHYTPDGYWRGPVWAPSTMLIVSGLNAVGEIELARQISERFCKTCAQSGFAENFDALTGEGLRDPAYTWTASVFIVLAHEFAS
ncbi:MAG: amylo-alpha-1,6-glucosidase [Anaerolineae bacterium]